MDADLFTAREASTLLDVSSRQVRRRADAGRGVERVGRYYRVAGRTRADLLDACPDIGRTSSGRPGHLDATSKTSKPTSETSDQSPDTALILRDAFQARSLQVRELQQTIEAQKKSGFRWRVVGVAACVTAAVGFGLVSLLFGLWKGQASELEQTRQHLTATTQTMQQQLSAEQTRTRNAESRADMAQQRLDEISREVIEQLRRDQDDQDTQADDWL